MADVDASTVAPVAETYSADYVAKLKAELDAANNEKLGYKNKLGGWEQQRRAQLLGRDRLEPERTDKLVDHPVARDVGQTHRAFVVAPLHCLAQHRQIARNDSIYSRIRPTGSRQGCSTLST